MSGSEAICAGSREHHQRHHQRPMRCPGCCWPSRRRRPRPTPRCRVRCRSSRGHRAGTPGGATGPVPRPKLHSCADCPTASRTDLRARSSALANAFGAAHRAQKIRNRSCATSRTPLSRCLWCAACRSTSRSPCRWFGRWPCRRTSRPTCRRARVWRRHRLRHGLGVERRRHRFELVLAHVVVHLAPAGVHGRLVGASIQRVAVLDRATGVAAGAADGLAVGFTARGHRVGRFAAEQVAAS